MGVKKENVYLASGLQQEKVCNVVVCSDSDEGVRKLLEQTRPGMKVVSVVGYVDYENTLRQIKDVLSGKDKSMPVYLDPALEKAA